MHIYEIRRRCINTARFIYRKTLKRTTFGRALVFKMKQRGWFVPPYDISDPLRFVIQTYTFRQKCMHVLRFVYRKTLKRTHFGQAFFLRMRQRGWFIVSCPTRVFLSPLSQELLMEAASSKAVDPVLGLCNSVPSIPFILSDILSVYPHINILLPILLDTPSETGKPNLALFLAAHLALAGEFVRLISTHTSLTEEVCDALYTHIEQLVQKPIDRKHVIFVDGFSSSGVSIGAYDFFVATTWQTAHIAKEAVKQTIETCFIYLIQDYAPLLHAASSMQARILETYGFSHVPITNTRLLLDHLAQQSWGQYADKAFVDRALYFEPAIDLSYYFPSTTSKKTEKKILLFDARPSTAECTLFEIGLAALKRAVASGYITNEVWEVWAIGEELEPVSLGKGVELKSFPQLCFEEYAERMRTADLLVSLMLSPNPSYHPIEMAASGKLVVTNSYGVKTKERLQAISPNILVAEPHVDGVTAVLKDALGRLNAGLPSCDPSGVVPLPRSWDDSFRALIPQLTDRLQELRIANTSHSKKVYQGYPADPKDSYSLFKRRRLADRRTEGPYVQIPGLISFLSPGFNISSSYLEELAASLFLQDGGTNFEWIVLDNGSTDPATLACLERLGKHPCVRLKRVEKNLGIVGGTRVCFEHATGRYIVPIDADDIVEPDCVHVLTKTLIQNGFPSCLYTDEDKLIKKKFIDPYVKPDWDPVLFSHSCYIAHLCAMDRVIALSLKLYTDPETEGCPDWDSFTRFMQAGYTPQHLSEILYSWRIHPQSTASSVTAKPYISSSHRALLTRFLKEKGSPHLELVFNPLSHQIDWWFKRKREQPQSWTTLCIANKDASAEKSFIVSPDDSICVFHTVLNKIESELVHIIWEDIDPVTDEWIWDAMGLMELFPDTVMVGGSLHDQRHILGGPMVFGFGKGCDCPDHGRSLLDPGWFVQMWKSHSVSAISSGHCVVSTRFLKQVIPHLIEENISLTSLGPWLGALAKEAGKRVVFSPFMQAKARQTPEMQISMHSWSHFLFRFWHLIPDTATYSVHLGLDQNSAYALVDTSIRNYQLSRIEEHKLSYLKNLLVR